MTARDEPQQVSVVATGVANTASVCAALRRLGCVTEMVTTPEDTAAAEFLVLPGVGAFAAAMTRLREADQIDALRQRVAADRPTLAICLGMQLFGTGSEEAPGEAGLRIERTSYLADGLVVEFTQSIYRGDAYNFVAELRLAKE